MLISTVCSDSECGMRSYELTRGTWAFVFGAVHCSGKGRDMINKSLTKPLNDQLALKSTVIPTKVAYFATNPGLGCKSWRATFSIFRYNYFRPKEAVNTSPMITGASLLGSATRRHRDRFLHKQYLLPDAYGADVQTISPRRQLAQPARVPTGEGRRTPLFRMRPAILWSAEGDGAGTEIGLNKPPPMRPGKGRRHAQQHQHSRESLHRHHH